MRLEELAKIATVSDSRTLGVLRSGTDAMTASSAAGYKKALASISDFALDHPELEGVPSVVFLCDWMVEMSLRGLTVKTAVHYLDLVSALYTSAVKEGRAEPTDAFRCVKARVAQLASDQWQPRISDEEFARFCNFTKLSHGNPERSDNDGDRLFADIVLFSIANNGMSLADVATLRRADLDGCGFESRAIAERHTDSRRRYVFPLGQSQKTPRRLENYVRVKVAQLLLSRDIGLAGSVDDTVRGYWAFAALKSGVSGTTAVRVLGAVPEALPVLRICAGETDFAADIAADVSRTVASIFLSNPVEWFAMRLRPGVEYDMLLRRLSSLKGRAVRPELFYPMEEISRRVGRRIVCKDVPVLPGIVFFRSRLTDISTLFAGIGDLAWCYKAGNSYSAIPLREMERFQQAVGTFTPGTEILPVGSVRPGKNDRVEILGGMFTGCTAAFDSERIESTSGGTVRTIYRLLLSSDNGIEWVVALDPRLVRKVPDNRDR